MAVKYECPKCGRRFAEWGAEKLGFKCPLDDRCPASAVGEEISLVRVGLNDEPAPSKASLRKKPKPVSVPISRSDDDIEETVEPVSDDEDADIDEDDDEGEETDDEEEESEVVVGASAAVVVDSDDSAEDDDDDDDDLAGNVDDADVEDAGDLEADDED